MWSESTGSGVTRRGFLVGAAASLGSRTAHAGREVPVCLPRTAATAPRPEVAVSLKKLSRILALRASGRDDGAPLFRTRSLGYLTLLGMTRLDGFVIDPSGEDVVVWGLKEPDRPPLHADDLIVALRTAHDRYVVTEKGRRVKYSPAISLDASGDTFRRLDAISIRDDAGRVEYRRVCSAPMVVRVDGMPRHTRLAKVLVDADFRMKLVSFGEVRLPIDNAFPASFEAQAASAILMDENDIDVDLAWNAGRKWFEAALFTYQTSSSGETFYLDRAKIKLSSRTQQITDDGRLVDGGPDDPFDAHFACAWTDRMEDIIDAESIWREMANIYRDFAVAEMIAGSDAFRRAGMNAAYLLDRHRIAEVQLPDTMPGFARFLEKPSGSGRMFSVCGGVSVGFSGDRLVASDRRDPALGRAGIAAVALAERAA